MMLMGLLLAFVCGHAIAWVYMFTHTGLSYSKSFVNSLVVIPTIVSMVMLVLSNNLVTAFGLMAIFAIVRFRNVLRDTLDTSFILSVIVIGMACGTLKFATAIAGCMMICLIMFYIRLTSFGTRHRYDTILNLHWERPAPEIRGLDDIFGRHTRRSRCVSERTVDGSSRGGFFLSAAFARSFTHGGSAGRVARDGRRVPSHRTEGGGGIRGLAYER